MAKTDSILPIIVIFVGATQEMQHNTTNRVNNLKRNTFSSLGYQLVNILCNFILPRLILSAYGSETNGLINSIAQFLQVIGFLELGVGSVVQSALYKPLADGDWIAVSKVVASAQRFFQRIAYILLGYVFLLVFIYPMIADQAFGWMYTAFLIAAISISSFAQYYFGAVDSLLLSADQHGYISYYAQTAAIVLNTVACTVLIFLDASIHMVKLTTSLLFLLRPLALRIYISRNYQIDRHIAYAEEPIRQKWNGIAQHIAAVVLDGTDAIVLTAFSTLSNVSVYSVYHLVIYGVKGLFTSLTHGVKPLLGELWAKQETRMLNQTFSWFEWLLHTATVFIFGCTGVLIVPFVQIYTRGILDVNYVQPLFAFLLTLAHAGHCLRLPYSAMILAAGHYKQTQHSYIIAAVLNVSLSVAAVLSFGLIGVAIGTLVSMLYQTIWMAYYISKNLNQWPFRNFLKQLLADVLTVCTAALLTQGISLSGVSYPAWIWMAIQVALIWAGVIAAVNLVFYPGHVSGIVRKLLRKHT